MIVTVSNLTSSVLVTAACKLEVGSWFKARDWHCDVRRGDLGVLEVF